MVKFFPKRTKLKTEKNIKDKVQEKTISCENIINHEPERVNADIINQFLQNVRK